MVLSAHSEQNCNEASADVLEVWRAEAAQPQGWRTSGIEGGAALQPMPPPTNGSPTPSAHSGMAPRAWALPKDLILDEREGVHWPLWFSPRSVGARSLQLAVCFESAGGLGGAGAAMRHRLLCIAHSVTVVPSVRVQTRLLPDPTCIHRRVLQLSVQNLQTATENFRLQQVSCISTAAQLQHMCADGEEARHGMRDLPLDAVVGPNETTNLYLHVEQRGLQGEAGSVALPPPPLLPVDAGPVAWFHACAQTGSADGSDGSAENGPEGRWPLRFALVWEVLRPGGAKRLGTSLAASTAPSTAIASGGGGSGRGSSSGSGNWGKAAADAVPLHAVLLAPPSPVTHDFAASPLCELELQLQVRNALPHPTACQVDCNLPSVPLAGSAGAGLPGAWHEDASQPASVAGGVDRQVGRLTGLPPSPAWLWVGPTHRVLTPLAPGETGRLSLRVAVIAPGRYLFDGYRLSACAEDLHTVTHTQPGPTCTINVLSAHTSDWETSF